MSTYRLFPSANGPGLTSYSGNFLAGVAFEVTQWGMWFEGYWWWCPAGGDTGAQKFALWQVTNTEAGIVVPAATVTSGTLTAGAWNYVPLASPVQLSAGVNYVAATGWTAVHGFPITSAQFGSGDPFAAGIVNGPLTAYSDASGSNPSPGNWATQGLFGTGGTDPSVTFPAQGSSSSSNFWIDLQVSDTAPAGYAGSYRLWPAQPKPLNMITDSGAFTIAAEFTLSQSCTLDNVWFYSPSGATTLPTECGILGQTSETLVPGTHNSSPSWSGAAGSGWVSCAYTGVTLAAGSYRVAVANSNGGSWNNASVDYFLTGAGSSGITTGPLSAPSEASADSPGQGSYNVGGTLAWPGTFDTGNGPSYWVDIEVTPAAATAAPPPGAQLIPPGLVSPMAFQRQAFPSGAPLLVAGADSGTGAESGSATATAVSADTGTGADGGTVTASAADSDAGSGADAGTVTATASGSDMGSGADSGAASVSAADADTGTAAEAAAVTVSSTDTGSGADSGYPLVPVSAADTGAGADSGSVTAAAVADTDTGQGAGSAAVTASAAGADSGHGTDSASAYQPAVLPPAAQLGGSAASGSTYGGSAVNTSDYGGSAQ